MQHYYPVAPARATFSFSFLRLVMLLAGLVALSACGIRLPGNSDSPTELAEAVTEFRVVSRVAGLYQRSVGHVGHGT